MHGLMTSRNEDKTPTDMTMNLNLTNSSKALYTAMYTVQGAAVCAAMIAFSQLRGSACRKMDEVMKPDKARSDSTESLPGRKISGWAG